MGQWICINGRQANSDELLTLLRTINGIEIQERGENILVCFPARKKSSISSRSSMISHVKKPINILGLSSKVMKTSDDENHYSAIMLK